MVSLLAASLALALPSPLPKTPPPPVLRLGLDGSISVRGSRWTTKFCPGTAAVRCPGGTAFALDGRLSGIMFGDPSALALTRSITIATWVRLESYVEIGPGAQIFFRGDDRNGLDPYSLTVMSNGRVYFNIVNSQNDWDQVSAPIPLREWTHVTASLDDKTGELRLWINGRTLDRRLTKTRPFARLDGRSSPGVSIGNVQNDRGPHNQPLHGLLADLAVYDQVVTPADLHLVQEGWNRPFH